MPLIKELLSSILTDDLNLLQFLLTVLMHIVLWVSSPSVNTLNSLAPCWEDIREGVSLLVNHPETFIAGAAAQLEDALEKLLHQLNE